MSNYKPTLTQTASQLIAGLFKHDNPSLNSASVLFSEPRVDAGKTKATVTLTDASFDVDIKQATITYDRIDLTTLFSVVELSVHGVLLKDDFDFQLIANDVLHYYKFNINEGFTVNNRDGGWYLTADSNNIAYVGEIPISRIATLEDRVVVDMLTEFEPQLPEIAIEFTQEKRAWDSTIPCKLVQISTEYKKVTYTDGLKIDDEYVTLYQANDKVTLTAIEEVKVTLEDGKLWEVNTYTLEEPITGSFNILTVSGGDYLIINSLDDSVVTSNLYKLNKLTMKLDKVTRVYYENYTDMPVVKAHVSGDKLFYVSSGLSSSSTKYIEISTGRIKTLRNSMDSSAHTAYTDEFIYTFDTVFTTDVFYRANQYNHDGDLIRSINIDPANFPSSSSTITTAYKNRLMAYDKFSRAFIVYDFDTGTTFIFKSSQPSTGLIPTVRYSHADVFYSGSGNLRKYQLS